MLCCPSSTCQGSNGSTHQHFWSQAPPVHLITPWEDEVEDRGRLCRTASSPRSARSSCDEKVKSGLPDFARRHLCRLKPDQAASHIHTCPWHRCCFLKSAAQTSACKTAIHSVLAVGQHGCHNAPLHGLPAQPETDGFVEVGCTSCCCRCPSMPWQQCVQHLFDTLDSP